MATSKHTRVPVSDTNQVLLDFFQKSHNPKETEQAWLDAIRHEGTGTPPLRFPVYEHLYRLNVCSQTMVDLLKTLSSRFGINRDASLYHQAMVQYVRASASRDLLESMVEIESTEAWLFDSQCRIEQRRLTDPDDVYLHVRKREAERVEKGLPPRIRFLDDPSAAKNSPSKPRKTASKTTG